MVVTIACLVCVVNSDCKECGQIVVKSQKVNNIEEPDKAVKNKETKEENIFETIKQDVESKIETTEPIVETETSSSSIVPSDFSNYDVPSNNTIKSYMDYRCITLKSSNQYKLQESSAYTGDHGIRMVNGRYCIAVGSYYTTTIGQYIDVELENGNVIKGILADCKADRDTDPTNRMHSDGSVVEFVVDTKSLDRTAKIMGDISYVNEWNSKIVNIKVYDKIEDF